MLSLPVSLVPHFVPSLTYPYSYIPLSLFFAPLRSSCHIYRRQSLGESLDMGNNEESWGARGTKLHVGAIFWRGCRLLAPTNAHDFQERERVPKVENAC